jgi:hypothetical protein
MSRNGVASAPGVEEEFLTFEYDADGRRVRKSHYQTISTPEFVEFRSETSQVAPEKPH